MAFLDPLYLRRELDARRVTSARALAFFFGVLFLALSCYGAHEGMRQYVARGLPAPPVLLALIAVWLGAGIPAQMRLTRDRQWSGFLRQMPVGPGALLLVHVSASLLLALGVGAVLLCAAGGARGGLLSLGALSLWIVTAAGAAWVLSVQVLLAMVLSRLKRGAFVLLVVLVLWVLFFVGRAAWGMLRFSAAGRFLDACAGDPGMLVFGVGPLLRALVEPDATAGRAVLHLALVASACWFGAWRLAALPGLMSSGPSFAVVLTRPLRRLAGRMSSSPAAAEVCVEWLRTLRGRSACVTMYAVAGVVLAVFLRTRPTVPEEAMAALVLLAFAMADDGTLEILKNRGGNRLYDACGADPRYYLLGFMTSVGTAMALLCIAQIPLYAAARSLRLVLLVGSVCLATSVSVIPIVVGVDAFFARLAGGSVRRVVAMMKTGLLAMMVPTVLFLLGSAHPAIPLALAALLVYAETRRAGRAAIERLYWRL